MKNICNQSYHRGKADVGEISAWVQEEKMTDQAGENLVADDVLGTWLQILYIMLSVEQMWTLYQKT